MPNREITNGAEARRKLTVGVNKVADSVKVTMGGAGRTVVIETPRPYVTKDGVTVAQAIELEDHIENMGANMVKEVANKTVDMAGDGTSLSVVLTQSMINEGLRSVENGISPIEIKSGMEKGAKQVLEKVKGLSKPVDDNETLMQIASISANNDTEIGKLIAQAYEKIGNEGVISIQPAQGETTSIEVVVTNSDKRQAEYENCIVFIANQKITKAEELHSVMLEAQKQQKPLVVICSELEGQALAVLALNKVQKGFPCVAVKAPHFGEQRKEVMNDIAILTGGGVLSEELGIKLPALPEGFLGTAQKVTVAKEFCQIVGGGGSKENIEKRCKELKGQLDLNLTEEAKWRVSKRIAKLSSGVAVMKVGGFTESEVMEKKDRVDDALCATRAAIDEGYVAGGGTTFLHCLDINTENMTEGERIGVKILKEAIQEPFNRILLNGGMNPAEFKKETVQGGYGYGINIKNQGFTDLFKAGIIDPTKVLRVALENSVSIAGVFLTTECVISTK
jgi:chaperonin GroEL